MKTTVFAVAVLGCVLLGGARAFTAELGPDLTLEWEVDAVAETVTFELSFVGPTGYAFIGIDPDDNGHANADIMGGYFDSGTGLAVIHDYWTEDTSGITLDTALGGSDADVVADADRPDRLRWTRALTTDDEFDRPLALDRDTKIVWALDTEFTPRDPADIAQHSSANRGIVLVNLATGAVDSARDVEAAHGVLMTLGHAVVIGVGVLAARAGLQRHHTLAMAIGVFTSTVGVVVGIGIGGGLTGHAILGWTTMALTWIQAVQGVVAERRREVDTATDAARRGCRWHVHLGRAVFVLALGATVSGVPPAFLVPAAVWTGALVLAFVLTFVVDARAGAKAEYRKSIVRSRFATEAKRAQRPRR